MGKIKLDLYSLQWHSITIEVMVKCLLAKNFECMCAYCIHLLLLFFHYLVVLYRWYRLKMNIVQLYFLLTATCYSTVSDSPQSPIPRHTRINEIREAAPTCTTIWYICTWFVWAHLNFGSVIGVVIESIRIASWPVFRQCLCLSHACLAAAIAQDRWLTTDEITASSYRRRHQSR